MITLRSGPIKLEVSEDNELYSTLKRFEGESFTVEISGQPKIHKVESNKEEDFLSLLESRKQEGQQVNIVEREEETERVSYNAKGYYLRFVDIFGKYEDDDSVPATYAILSSHVEYYVPKHLEKAYDDMSIEKSTDELAVLRTRNNGSVSYVSVPRELLLDDTGS